MRVFFDTTCPRCGFRMTTQGEELARLAATLHYCADGVKTTGGDPVKREVPGPGERTKLPEERN